MSETVPAEGAQAPGVFRFGWQWWVAIAAAALIMAGGLVVVVATMNANADAPRVAVGAYLSALQRGDASKALALDGVKVGSSDVLLTDKAYRNATKRISAFSLGTPVVKGDVATVAATITQGAHHYRQAFQLDRAGRSFVAFDEWKLQSVPLTKVAIEFDGPEGVGFTIVGQSIGSAAQVELRALPGTYNVLSSNSSPMFYTAPFTVTAIGFGSAKPQPAKVSIGLSWEGDKAARDAVAAFLDKCAASTALVPAGCPFHAFSAAGITVDSAHWTIARRPEVSIGPFTDGAWPVLSTTLGSAKLSGTAHDGAGNSGDVHTSDLPFALIGTITFSGETATYSQLIK
jgi:hypothetical protein